MKVIDQPIQHIVVKCDDDGNYEVECLRCDIINKKNAKIPKEKGYKPIKEVKLLTSPEEFNRFEDWVNIHVIH